MDKNQSARSRLRQRLAAWHKEAQALAVREKERRIHLFSSAKESGASVHYWDIYRPMHDCLKKLAEDEEIGSLARELRERRPLKIVDGITSFDWVVASPNPNAPTLPYSPEIPMLWEIVVEALIPEWLDYLDAPAPQAAAAPPSLGKKARAVLKLLYRDKAFDEHHACKLANRAPSALPYPTAKSPQTRVKYAEEGSSELVTKGLARALPHTGTWLTPEGKAEAERLFKQ
jgi:hypothetical protein